jgi:hypothetical protein
MTSYRINNLRDPSSNQDAATKSYVDTATAGMATTTAVNTAITTALGSSGSMVNNPSCDLSSLPENCYIVGVTNVQGGNIRRQLISGTSAPYFKSNVLVTPNLVVDNFLGIGTLGPLYPLHVKKTGTNAWTGNYRYDGTRYLESSGDMNRPVTLGVEQGWIACDTGVIMFSDQRIKSDIINVDIQSNLELFRKIRPVKHGYIDKLEYGNFKKYGFIAQEVKQLLPEAVVEGTQVIPSVYCNANIVNTQNNFLLRFEKPLKDIQQFKIGIKLKCYDTKNEIVWVTIKEIIDAQNIEVEENITNDKLFVYGHSVDDFLQIEKDTIWTVATAALQEVDRQQQADKARIAELENTVATQQSLINDILERLKTLEKA